jgi:hypothetical protein
MSDRYEIEVFYDTVHVWATNWKGRCTLAAEFNKSQTLQEIAQEIYDLLAMSGHEVKFKEG